MNLSGFVGVAIGIIFMYLMLSLMCTVINEIIATLFQLRAKFLSSTIVRIIDDRDVLDAFYKNGLIAASQIASGATNISKNQPAAVAGSANPPIPKVPDHPSYFDSRNVAMAILDSLDPEVQKDPDKQKVFPTFTDIEDLVGKMKDSAIRDVLLANIAMAGKDLSLLRNNLASWFDTAMDRLSGDYQRRSRTIAVVVGFLLAGLLNADTYRVGVALWNDQALQDQLVAQAAVVLKSEPPTDCLEEASANTPDKKSQDQTLVRVACLARTLKSEQDSLRPLPLGWSVDQLPKLEIGLPLLWWIVMKAGAFAWTGLALSLGAPFWFDLLEKVMNIRGAGPKPAESRTADDATN